MTNKPTDSMWDSQGLGENFTDAYITPHIGEFSPSNNKNKDTHRELYELMEDIRTQIEKNMGSVEARRVLQAIRHRETLLTKR